MRKASCSVLMGLFSAVSSMAMAQPGPRAALDVSVGGGVDSNPFLYNDSGSAASMRADATGRLIFENELGKTTLEGGARLSQYTNGYGSDEAAHVGVNTTRRLTERLRVNGEVRYALSRSAFQDMWSARGDDLLELEPDQSPVIPDIDPTLAGLRTRLNRLSGSAGADYILKSGNVVSIGGSAADSNFRSENGLDSRQYTGQASYMHRLSPRTTLIFSGQASFINYLRRVAGDSTVLSPTVGIRQQLSETLVLDVSGGISHVSMKTLAGDRDSDIAFAGSASLCKRGEKSVFCLSGQRSAQPTAFQGVTQMTSLSANYAMRLSKADRLSLSGRYAVTDRNTDLLAGLTGFKSEIYGGNIRYSHDFSDRLSFFVSPGYSKLSENAFRNGSNLYVQAGLRARIGSLR